MLTVLKRIYRSQLKTGAMWALIIFSLIWIISDHSRLSALSSQASEIALAGIFLAITEACFIIGAVLMAASVGVTVAEQEHWIRGWYKHLRYVHREAKSIAHAMFESKLFAIGFWLNFFGAVGTSVVLVAVLLRYVPLAGSGLLVVLIIDLAATFGWRIPLHMKRKSHLKANKITIRQAKFADIDSYLKLQDERWTEDNMANRAQLESRFKSYPQGMLVAERGGEIVGMVYAMRITRYDYDNPPSWNDITNNGYCDNVDPNGAAMFGVDLSTAKGVGHLAGDQLLVGIGRLVVSNGLKESLLGGRMPGYHNYADKMSAAEYLVAKADSGKPLDRQVQYYTSVPGLRALKVLPNYFDDPESLDYGVLLRWRNPLYGLPAPRFWGAIFPALLHLEELYIKIFK